MVAQATSDAPQPKPAPAPAQLPKDPPPGFGIPEKRGSVSGDAKA